MWESFSTKNIFFLVKQIKEQQKISLKKESGIYSDDDFFLGLSRFERKEIIYKGDFSKLYKFIEKETGKILTGQMSMVKTGRISKDDATQLKIELKKIFQLNHPSLLAIIGCSPVDFKKEKKPVIVT